ncbi:LytR/AlgR family response regulator transcription factor [Pendulispora albinea]|uniref:LytTR family DNA-binding domain-containing protein n=1 Tax=Pendulispora albinea TaxID=2741071 RepID=A0ABZ2M519_9BACT
MRLRALVVEDEWPARNYLVELLHGSGVAEVVGAVGDIESAREALRVATPNFGLDVVFVDVQFANDGDEAGLDLIRSMNPGPRSPAVVLATAFEQHALEAFDLGVVDYLLKPFTEERVLQCLLRVRDRRTSLAPPSGLSPEGPSRIVARRKNRLVFLDAHEIWAFEAADRLTFVHTVHGTFDIDLSLSAIEASFGHAFARVHRNWLVNASSVKELERDGNETHLFVGLGLRDEGNGVRVPVARDRAQAIREMLLTNTAGIRRV